jgi:hypothetical protein
MDFALGDWRKNESVKQPISLIQSFRSQVKEILKYVFFMEIWYKEICLSKYYVIYVSESMF